MCSENPSGQKALRKGRFSHENSRYFITICTEQRTPILTKFGVPELVFECLQKTEAHFDLVASIVMADHIHFVIHLKNPSLGKAMKSFKGQSANLINRSMDRKGAVWQKGYFDHKFRSDDDLAPILLYMWNNPNLSGKNFRCNREDWLWFKSIVTKNVEYPAWLSANPIGI